MHVLALQLQLVVRRVTVRGPFQRTVNDPGARGAREGVRNWCSELVGVLVSTVARVCLQPRDPNAPAGGVADVASHMCEKCSTAERVELRCVPGKLRPLPASAP